MKTENNIIPPIVPRVEAPAFLVNVLCFLLVKKRPNNKRTNRHTRPLDLALTRNPGTEGPTPRLSAQKSRDPRRPGRYATGMARMPSPGRTLLVTEKFNSFKTLRVASQFFYCIDDREIGSKHQCVSVSNFYFSISKARENVRGNSMCCLLYHLEWCR